MRILIVTQYFWPENFRVNDLASGLKEMGHEVIVLTGKPNYPGGRFFEGYGFFKGSRDNYYGIRVLRVPLIPRGNGAGWRLITNYLSFVFFASLLSPFLCRGRYDVIFVYEPSPITVGLPALVLKKIKHAPIMFWVQDLWPESLSATGAIRSEWALRAVDKLVRFIYKGCDLVLVQSRAFFEPIEKVGVPRERIQYFPNSAEELYQPVITADNAPERSVMPSGFCVMFAGNIGKAQDFETILEAAERTRTRSDIHWVILGDGRMFPWLEGQVKKRGLTSTVHLLGRHPADSMPRYFALADAMLVTLRKEPIFSMTIPAKVQSYLACAKPLIAALEGEGARVVREADAGLTPGPEDPRALVEAVITMYYMNDAERREMGLRARRYFEDHFERDMLLRRLDGWMKELKDQMSLCAS
jgi:glycosyltransferase involved in cell wall biosynthesis